MDRRNYLLQTRPEPRHRVRAYVEATLNSLEWWAQKTEAVEWDRSPADPWWRAELDLDGAEIPEEDFEDGFNCTGFKRVQLRGYDGEPADEWEPYDRVDQILLLHEGHTYDLPPDKELRPRKMPREHAPLPEVSYSKKIDGKLVVQQTTPEVWWYRSLKRTATVAHMARTIEEIKTAHGGRVTILRTAATNMCSKTHSDSVYIWQGPPPEDLCSKCRVLYNQKMEESPNADDQ